MALDAETQAAAIAAMRQALNSEPPDFASMVALVQAAGEILLDVVDDTGHRTPLHIAALHGKVAYAGMLVARGADINARDTSNWTPLMSAAFGEANGMMGLQTAKLLLQLGANVDAVCSLGSHTLHIVAAYGSIDFAELILNAGANPNVVDNEGETPLHKAAVRGSLEMTKFLVSRGAHPHLPSRSGLDPVQYARREGTSDNLKVADFLESCQ